MGSHNKNTPKSVYVIDIHNDKVTTANKIKLDFAKMPEEVRWDFCNNYEEYIYRMEQAGNCVVLRRNHTIMCDKIVTPKQYGDRLGIDMPNNITLELFDRVVADGYCLWNYPLCEYEYIVQNGLKVVLVKFASGEYRFVQVRRDMI